MNSQIFAKDEHGRLLVAAAVGVTSDTFERAEALLEAVPMRLLSILHMAIVPALFAKLKKFVKRSLKQH